MPRTISRSAMVRRPVGAWLVAAVVVGVAPPLTAASTEGTVHDSIYTPITIDGVSKILNQHGAIGGQTKMRGDVGTLYRISNPAELSNFVNKAPKTDYIVLIARPMLADTSIDGKFALKACDDTGNLVGVMVYSIAGDTEPMPFSAGDKCPNCDNGLPYDTEVVWNRYGGGYGDDGETGLHWTYLGKPMTLITDSDNTTVHQFYEKNTKVGGQSPIGFFVPYADVDDNDPYKGSSLSSDVVMLAAPIDAVSIFHDNSYGFDSAASVAAMLAVAELLGALPRGVAPGCSTDIASNMTTMLSKFNKNIMFSFFAAEHWGYSGSSSLGYKINQKTVPSREHNFDQENVKYYIELGSVAYALKERDTVYFRTDVSGTAPSTANLTAELNATDQSTAFPAVNFAAQLSSNAGIPPSSYRGLFNELSEARVTTTGATVVTGYGGDSYENHYYETMLDAANRMNLTEDTTTDEAWVGKLCQVATQIAKVAVKMALANPDDDFDTVWQMFVSDGTQAHPGHVDCDYMLEVLKTMTVKKSRSAGLVGEYWPAGQTGPINRYASVFSDWQDIASDSDKYVFVQLANALRLNRELDCATAENQGKYKYNITKDAEYDEDSGANQLESCYNTYSIGSAMTGTYNGNDAAGATRYNPIRTFQANNDGYRNCFFSSVSWVRLES